tara:strand:+ start:115 stop:438 length:324 start_codon:yes stop_codon:yes gene_type:complete
MKNTNLLNYLKNLKYRPANLPNCFVYYGDIKSLCISPKSSAFVSNGIIEIFTNDEKHITQDWSRHIIKLTAESAELKNETNKNIFAILQESILLPDNYTDIVFSLKN